MQHVTDHVDAAFLLQPPPRSLPPHTLWSLVRAHVSRRRFAFLDPLIIIGVVGLIALALFHAPWFTYAVLAILVLWRAGRGVLWLWRNVRDDSMLLREGHVVTADVRKLRPYRTPGGDIDGALIDCEIPVATRRTYVGSVWLADGREAQHLVEQGHVDVLRLPHVPGTWRIVEHVSSQILYQRVGPAAELPENVE
ncbi:MAG TPA: hypothetical protein VFT66_07260 [Roseiflexaceae bacterium]|jgi:hypothetical protein|nr:hypothetical protein [Roseiflexaceae bacterium]